MVEAFFAGLWSIIWKYILAIGFGGCLLIVAFVPIAWIPMWVRKLSLWAGGLIVACTIAYSVGIRDEHQRAVAQTGVLVGKEIRDNEKAGNDADAWVERNGLGGVSNDRNNRDNWTRDK